MGYGFFLLFLPKRLHSTYRSLSPWFGILLIVILGASLNLSKIPMMKPIYDISYFKGIYIILFFAIFLTLESYIEKKYTLSFSREDIFLFFTSCLGIVFFLAFFRFDMQIVSEDASLLQNKTLIEEIIISKKIPRYTYQIGAPVIVAFFAGVFSRDTSVVAAGLPALFLSLIFPLICLYIRKLFCIQRLSFLFIIEVFVGYIGVLYFVYKSYHFELNYLISVGLILLFFSLLWEYFKQSVVEKTVDFKLTGYDLLLSVIFSSLIIIDGLLFKTIAFMYLVIFLIIVIRYYRRWNICYIFAKIFLIALMINPLMVGFALWSGR